MGLGYPAYVAGRLGMENPGKYQFYNRGIGGHRIVDIYARIKRDIINLQPDYMSLLVGVNDVWHELEEGNGVETEKFKKIYEILLDEVEAALPNLRIMLMEPFVLPGTGTKAYYSQFRKGVQERAETVRQLAEERHLPLIRFQADLNRLAETAPEGYWLYDGVHPSIYFHQYMADKWIETFRLVENVK